jgi:acetyltransferase-like isoleucine patch superfamily enzyme
MLTATPGVTASTVALVTPRGRLAGLRRRVRAAQRQTPIEDLARLLSVRLGDRVVHCPETTFVGTDNRLDSVVLHGRANRTAEVRIGDCCDLQGAWVLDNVGASISIGSRTELNDACQINCIDRVVIGDDVLVAAQVYIADNDSHSADWEHRRHDHMARRAGARDWSVVPHAPVHIESKAWIGRRAMIFKGVTIGEGAIVAAGSVVTQSVEPWTVVAGVPAREIRRLTRPAEGQASPAAPGADRRAETP